MNKFQDTIIRLNRVIVDRDTELSYTKKTANNRLALLMELNKDRVDHLQRCPSCKEMPKIVGLNVFEDYHADSCELEEELGK